MLVLDAGNALFKSRDSAQAPDARARAELVLSQMDAQGTAAMAVGARDLGFGVGFLRKQTRQAKLKLLSANLADAQGKLLFPASLVTTVGGVKVGVVGVSPAMAKPMPVGLAVPGQAQEQVQGLPVQPAVAAETKRLREKSKVDLVVVLAAVPHAEALQLADQVEGVDFVVQSHEGRGQGIAQRQALATVIPSGARGRELAKLVLQLEGTGRFADASLQERTRQQLRLLEGNLTRAKARLAGTQDPAEKRPLEATIARLEASRAAYQKELAGGATDAGRTHLLSYIQLGSDVPADPVVQKWVERVEPPGSAAH
ncbi:MULTISPECIES: 5'-nucleotidase [unclassified Myxococcus]|uniref:5'-nucleotidase n=1 Tax=Myxococcus TaxID=32 RepID=UPI00114296B8|nr:MULTISPECIES: 5'-nucleotidase [unclassified Myxococcus]NOK00578.1 5'-nucleotidase [Myxococcus xanthus]